MPVKPIDHLDIFSEARRLRRADLIFFVANMTKTECLFVLECAGTRGNPSSSLESLRESAGRAISAGRIDPLKMTIVER